MNEIESLGNRAANNASQTSAFSELSSEEFVRIMFAELANQDPLEPNDSEAMLSQLSSLRSIESDVTLTQKLDSMVSRNEFASASGLIGQVISGVSETEGPVIDRVFSVSQTSDGPILNLFGGARVRLDKVLEVAAHDPAAAAGVGDD